MKQQYDYEIVVESQLGPRHGTLSMEETDDVVSGTLSLLSFENSVTGKREGKKLCLHHKLRTLVSQLTCRTDLEMQENFLMGTIHSEFGSMKIHGQKKQETEHTTA